MKQIFKNKTGLLVVLIVGILAMTIAFAAMSTQLNIFGTAKISSGSYKVVIDDWAQSTTPSLVSGATNTGYQITAASVTSNTMTISGLKVGFKQPGDAVKYTFNIENQGSIDASLSSFTLGTPTCTNATTSEPTTCPSMTYEVKCGSPAAVPASGDNLLAGQTISCYYYLAYNVVDASSLNQPAIEVSNITASWTYTQKSTSSYTPGTTMYTLKFNSVGGSSVSDIKALGGSDITLPEPTKEGYEFDGWYTEETGGTKITSTTMPTSNTTYYAHWNETFICKTATTLHTETCTNDLSSNLYCYADGYYSGGSKDTATITYGNTNLLNGKMRTGYALDCKVSKTGGYTERFYYVSNYFDPNTNSFDSNYATLIYYNSYVTGNTSYYAPSQENWHGPASALTSLPTKNEWNNIELKNTNRQIYSSGGINYYNTTGNGTYNLPVFSYEGYAARLLTYNELKTGCSSASINNNGGLSSCNFVFENTKYANNSNAITTLLLETVNSASSNYVIAIHPSSRYVSNATNTNISSGGAIHPVIDVPYSKIQLQ